MSADTDQVVVTGLGATTPLGGDMASTWAGLLAGRSGIGRIEEEWAAGSPVRIAGTLAVEPTEVLDRVRARRMDRCQQIALVTAREAWADAGAPDVDPERLAVGPTPLRPLPLPALEGIEVYLKDESAPPPAA
ncbi:hypothetical protein GCM10010246_33740 [Streptomyces cuspidosporus]|uniref:Beta-ketoacyl synthase-like N-terminal domain-containing protein n=1 Tax=Streptomyces cuspidosporus TaxID=66882 RepID=A0ABN3G6U3_9ACTN